jgi:hypothetical protein
MCVGVFHPQSSGIRQSCYHLPKGETENITYGILARNYGEIVAK